MAKRAMGVKLVDGRTGNADLDWLHNKVGQLAQQANLPMPEVGYYESPEVNAFATGPSKKRSLVAVSTGLLRQMDKREVEGVLAHEVSHIANGDMVTMTLHPGSGERLRALPLAHRGHDRAQRALFRVTSAARPSSASSRDTSSSSRRRSPSACSAR